MTPACTELYRRVHSALAVAGHCSTKDPTAESDVAFTSTFGQEHQHRAQPSHRQPVHHDRVALGGFRRQTPRRIDRPGRRSRSARRAPSHVHRRIRLCRGHRWSPGLDGQKNR